MANPNHPPAFLFYPNDFTSDSKVEAMTTEEVGSYILLLCKAWRESPVGSLPDDDRVLARWSRMTPDRWMEAKASVLAPFTLGTDSRWHQKRLRSEYQKLCALRKKRTEAGKSGASKRWEIPSDSKQGHSKRMAKPKQTDGISSSSSSSNGGGFTPTPPAGGADVAAAEKPNPSRSGNAELPAGFASFWAEYPNTAGRKVDRAGCLRRWTRCGLEALSGEILAGLARWKASHSWLRDHGQYVCLAATFLNQRRWETDPGGDGGASYPIGPRGPSDLSDGTELSEDERRRIADEVIRAAS